MSKLLKKIKGMCIIAYLYLKPSMSYTDLFRITELVIFQIEKNWENSDKKSKEEKTKQMKEARSILQRLRSDSYADHIQSSSLDEADLLNKSQNLKQEDKNRLATLLTDEVFSWR